MCTLIIINRYMSSSTVYVERKPVDETRNLYSPLWSCGGEGAGSRA